MPARGASVALFISGGELDQVNRSLEAHHGEYTDARANLNDPLNLLEHCADIYTRCDDANRRLCNQAFFTTVYVDKTTHSARTMPDHSRCCSTLR